MEKLSGLGTYIREPSKVFEEFKDKTIIFFDTETTGLKSHINQITELAAVVVKGPEFNILEEFDEKIALTEKTLKQIEEQKPKTKNPKFFGVEKALKFNKYHENKKEAKDEKAVLEDFVKLVKKYGKPILIAHNAKFDMSFVGRRVKKITGEKLPVEKVFDTMQFAKFFFVPAVEALSKKEVLKEKIRKRLMKEKGKYGPYTSVQLKKMISAFAIAKGSLHTAIVDTRQTVQVFKKLINYFKEYSDIHKDQDYKSELAKRLVKERGYKLSPGKRKYLKEQEKKKKEDK